MLRVCATMNTHVRLTAAGAEGGAPDGGSDDREAAVAEPRGTPLQQFLEVLTVGEDSRLILWRGLPPMTEVDSMLRSQAVCPASHRCAAEPC